MYRKKRDRSIDICLNSPAPIPLFYLVPCPDVAYYFVKKTMYRHAIQLLRKKRDILPPFFHNTYKIIQMHNILHKNNI